MNKDMKTNMKKNKQKTTTRSRQSVVALVLVLVLVLVCTHGASAYDRSMLSHLLRDTIGT
jgi:hypothetical protein